MSNKNKQKSSQYVVSHVGDVTRNVGLVMMTLAATAGLVDLPGQHDKRAILGQKPVYAYAGAMQGSTADQTLRRERDDIAPHYVSYSSFQRTPGRTGRI